MIRYKRTIGDSSVEINFETMGQLFEYLEWENTEVACDFEI